MSLDNQGIGFVSSYDTFNVWNGGITYSAGQGGGQVVAFTAQLYNATSGMIPCQLEVSMVQLSFCLIVGTATTGQQTAQTFTSVATGIFNTTTPAGSLAYGQAATFTISSLLQGSIYTSASLQPTNLTLASVYSLPSTQVCCYSTLHNDNVFALAAGGATGVSLDNQGIGFVSSYDTFNVWNGGITYSAGQGGGQVVAFTAQLYNATSGMIPCQLEVSMVQLSFCLIVGTATTGQQTAQTFTSVATGIFNTTTPAGSLAYGQAATFTISSLLQGSIYTSASLQPTNLTLASVYSLPSTQVCCYSTLHNDNVFALAAGGATGVSLDNQGIGFVSSYDTFNVWNGGITYSAGQGGGQVVAFTAQLYNATSGMIPCQLEVSMVQLSFCLIVGTATTGQQTAQTFTSVATGIFNTTTPAGSLAYGQAATFTISSLLQGSIYTSASLQPTNLTLASVYSLPSTQVCCYSTLHNDNVFALAAGGATGVSLDNQGIGFVSSYDTFNVWNGGITYSAGQGGGQVVAFTAQLYNATSGMIPCQLEVSMVQLSFCLIVGTATTGQQTAQTFTSVATGIFNTTTPAGSLAYGQAATFTISSLLQGSIYTSASLQPHEPHLGQCVQPSLHPGVLLQHPPQ